MDKYIIAEEAYKKGYNFGYNKGFDEAMTQLSLIKKEPSSREAKWNVLKHELVHWGYDDMCSDTIDAVRVIANEMSWRLVMRVIHKLRRKRGVER